METSSDKNQNNTKILGNPTSSVSSSSSSLSVSLSSNSKNRQSFPQNGEYRRSQNPFYIWSAIKSKKRLQLSTINKILNSSEGRDKITKVFQYLWRLLAYLYLKQSNRIQHKFYTGLYRAFQQTRKISHLLSSLSEWEKGLLELQQLRQILEKSNENSGDHNKIQKIQEHLLKSIKHGFFGIYWSADNMLLLNQLNVLNINNKIIVGSIGYAWFVSSISAALLAFQSLEQNITKKEKINQVIREMQGLSEKQKQQVSFRLENQTKNQTTDKEPINEKNHESIRSVQWRPIHESKYSATKDILDNNVDYYDNIEEEGTKFEIAIFNSILDLVKCGADTVCAVNLLLVSKSLPFESLKKFHLNDGIVGVSGIISALTVLFKMY